MLLLSRPRPRSLTIVAKNDKGGNMASVRKADFWAEVLSEVFFQEGVALTKALFKMVEK